MTAHTSWFDVDKEGLAKILKRRGMEFALYELISNAWDTDATTVAVHMKPRDGRPLVDLTIADDDPRGFNNLASAFTLFGDSERKADPCKRGRFMLGEKLVLALCEEAKIVSMRDAVHFTKEGRHSIPQREKLGTTVAMLIRMTRAELQEVLGAVDLLLPPIETNVAGPDGIKTVERRKPLHTFEVTLPTEFPDEEGNLRRSARKTEVRVYEPWGGSSRLYEMGIPVVEIDLPWTVEIMQKIPLTIDRENVTPSFLRTVGVEVVNEMHKYLKPEQATLPAVQEALGDERIKAEAVNTILTHQHGDQRVVLDPRDPEANARAFGAGFTVIRGSAYSKDQWEQIRKAQAAPASTHLFPTKSIYSDDPNAPTAESVPEDKWTPGMANLAAYAHELAWRVIHKSVDVRFEKRFGAIDAANYGNGRLCFNVSKLGYAWFDQGPCERVNDLLIHELAHEFGHHLTEEFDDGLSRIGAKMVQLALSEPAFFKKYEGK